MRRRDGRARPTDVSGSIGVQAGGERIRLACAVALGLLVLISAFSPRAEAYEHYWECDRSPYVQCYDTTGQIHNPWIAEKANMPFGAPAGYTGICVKAVTAAGNTRSGGAECGTGVSIFRCIAGASPWSQAYTYWGGSGWSAARVRGAAYTSLPGC